MKSIHCRHEGSPATSSALPPRATTTPLAAVCLSLTLLALGLSPSPAAGYGVFQVIRHQVTGFENLDQVESTAISPDGRHLYSGGVDAITVMSRDAATGALAPIQVLRSGGADGFEVLFLSQLLVSPDGLNVYVGSTTDSAVVVFARDPASGRLSFVQRLWDNENGADGLRLLIDMAISSDGRQVYTLAFGEKEIGVYDRDLSTGALTLIDLENGIGEVPEMLNPRGMAVAPDGGHLYVADLVGGLLTFLRRSDDGALTYEGAISGDVLVSDRLWDVTLSPDSTSLYLSGTASGMGNVIVGFNRDPASGVLEQNDFVSELENRQYLVVDASGSSVYLTGDSSVEVLDRDAQGRLTLRQTVLQGESGVEGLAGGGVGVLDAEGRHLYIPAVATEAIVSFERTASTGELTFLDAAFDGEGATLDGLGGSVYVHAPADGRDVYLADRENHALVQYRRDAAGHLSLGQVISLSELGFSESAEFVRPVGSPDGRFLILIEAQGNALWIFRRDMASGSLQWVRRQNLETAFFRFVFSPDSRFVFTSGGSDGFGGWELDANMGEFSRYPIHLVGTPSVDFVHIALAIDPGGRFIFGGGESQEFGSPGVIQVFEWDRATDVATFRGEVSHPALGRAVSGLTMTPDGRFLLATGFDDSDAGPPGLVVFALDSETGMLTEVQTLFDGVDGLNGFVNPVMGELSFEGKHLVVAAIDADSRVGVSTFLALDPSTGRLSVEEQRTKGDGRGPAEVGSYNRLAWGPTDEQFYALSSLGDALFAFDVDATGPCEPGTTVLCLGQNDRFRVEVSWTDFAGGSGIGTKVTESIDSGLFWFFDAANWEMLVKVIDGCSLNGHFWVFAAATTNVEYTLTVTDTQSGASAVFENPLGTSSAAITDTEALSSCP